MMDREARLVLETAVADLREINQKLQGILPRATGDLRAELLQIQSQSEAAIRYYNYVLARHPRTASAPELAQRVAQAAFGASGVGLMPPQFVMPQSGSEPRA